MESPNRTLPIALAPDAIPAHNGSLGDGVTVELYIMPLSRFLSGNFASDAMQQAWRMGADYRMPTAAGGGSRPRGVPYGGPDAPRLQDEWLEKTQRFMLDLPAELGGVHWNESARQSRYHSLTEVGLEELRRQARRRLDKRPTLGGLISRRRYRSHTGHAQVFLPVLFESAFSHEERQYGSVLTLLKELTQAEWTSPAAACVKVLQAAGREAAELRLPLIVGVPGAQN